MHTKGPWKYTPNSQVRFGHADEYPWNTLTDACGQPIVKSSVRTYEEINANCHLIREAPNLLNWLELAVDMLEHPDDYCPPLPDTISGMRRTISMAKGREQIF